MEIRYKQRQVDLGGWSKGSIVVMDFDNVNEINDGIKNLIGAETQMLSENSFTFGKYGVKTVDEILKGTSMFDNPPKERKTGRKEVFKSVKRRKQYNDISGEIDVDRALSGSMSPFRKKVVRRAVQRNLKIYISTSAIYGGITTEEMEEFTNAAINEIYQYVSSGRMVSVYIVDTALNAFSTNDCIVRVKIKDDRKPIDYKRLASLIYPAWVRYFIYEAHTLGKFKSKSDKGNPLKSSSKEAELIKACYGDEKMMVFDFGDWKRAGKKFAIVD